MKRIGPRLRKILGILALAASLISAYWGGYQAGLRDQGPDQRALATFRRNPDGSRGGASYTWFNVRNPIEAAKLRWEEERLKAAGTEYYVAKGKLESTLSPEIDPLRVHSHR